MICTSCRESTISQDNFARFKCPSCLNVEITRCEACRRKSNIYICPECGFEGP